MLNRRFSARERLLLLILILLFTATIYVVVVYNPTNTSIGEARSEYSVLETTRDYELIKAEELAAMRASLQKMEDSGVEFETIPVFDNISSVAPLLNNALRNASDYDLRFMPVNFDGNFAVRSIEMMFTAANYAAAAGIVEELANGPYSCSISELSLTSKDNNDISITAGVVEISLTITFYEVYHPTTTETEFTTEDMGIEYSDEGIMMA